MKSTIPMLMRLHSGCIHLASGIYINCCNQAAPHCSSISFFTPVLLRAASIAFKKACNLAALQQQTIGLQPLQQRHYLSKRVWPFYDHAVHVPVPTLVDSVKAHIHTYQKPRSDLPNTLRLAWDYPWPSFELKKKRGVSYFTHTSSSCVHIFYLFLALHVFHLQTYQTCMLLVDYKHFFFAHLLSCLPTTWYIQSSYCHASYLQSSCTNFVKNLKHNWRFINQDHCLLWCVASICFLFRSFFRIFTHGDHQNRCQGAPALHHALLQHMSHHHALLLLQYAMLKSIPQMTNGWLLSIWRTNFKMKPTLLLLCCAVELLCNLISWCCSFAFPFCFGLRDSFTFCLCHSSAFRLCRSFAFRLCRRFVFRLCGGFAFRLCPSFAFRLCCRFAFRNCCSFAFRFQNFSCCRFFVCIFHLPIFLVGTGFNLWKKMVQSSFRFPKQSVWVARPGLRLNFAIRSKTISVSILSWMILIFNSLCKRKLFAITSCLASLRGWNDFSF